MRRSRAGPSPECFQRAALSGNDPCAMSHGEKRSGWSVTRVRAAHRAMLWLGIPLVLAFALAMLVYPGQVFGPPAGRGYSFSMEFLSALGRVRTPDGTANPLASVLFNGGLVGCGILYGMFFWPARATFVDRPLWRKLVLLSGGAMAVGIAGIGLTPFDRFPRIHDGFCSVTSVSGCLAVGVSLALSGGRLEPIASRRATFGLLALVVAAAIAIRVGIDGGGLPTRPAMPLLQKAAVALLIGWTFWQSWLMGRCIDRGEGNGDLGRSSDGGEERR